MVQVSFTVYGKPQAAGSKRGFSPMGSTRVVITDANKKSKPWQAEVRAVARDACEAIGLAELLAGALRFSARFFFARPKGHFGSGKNATVLKQSAPLFHTQKPDVLKVTRGVEDALTGIVYRDDCFIVDEHITKEWTVGSSRVEIQITLLEEIAHVGTEQARQVDGGVRSLPCVAGSE